MITKACRTRDLSAELTVVTRDYWRKQVFVTRAKNLSKFCRTRGISLSAQLILALSVRQAYN